MEKSDIGLYGHCSGNIELLLDSLKENWEYPEDVIIEKRKNKTILELHTCGNSDNEAIIEILSTTMFWHMFWDKSVRGGHYYFIIDKNIKY